MGSTGRARPHYTASNISVIIFFFFQYFTMGGHSLLALWAAFFPSQALSKRIHYGKFVAEAKYRASPELFEAAIRAQATPVDGSRALQRRYLLKKFWNFLLLTVQDGDLILQQLTYETVESAIKERVEMKARVFGQEFVGKSDGRPPAYKIEPRLVAELYGEWIMPLTKEVQVQYLLRRLD